jgi:hypothetical protein
MLYVSSGAGSTMFRDLYRSVFLFNTVTLDDGCSVSAATFSPYLGSKFDGLVDTPTVNVCSSAPASNTDLVAGDYDSLGTTLFASSKLWRDITSYAYNNFALNAAGIAAISKTGVTKLGVRYNDIDVSRGTPHWVQYQTNSIMMTYAEGGSNKPKLAVTWSMGIGTISKVNDVTKATISKVDVAAWGTLKSFNGVL